MDLHKAIQQLYAEKRETRAVIASLEELQRSAGAIPALTQGIKRRGRKFMDPKERQEVSERMKKYWPPAARRSSRTRLGHGCRARARVYRGSGFLKYQSQ